MFIRMSIVLFLSGGAVSTAQPPQKDQQALSSQSKNSDPHAKGRSHQSIVVDAASTPEEIEDGRINQIFQPVYEIQLQHECDSAIEKYRSIVIPSADKSKYQLSRNKFLFLAYRAIGDCDMELGKFSEAEESYQKAFDYTSVWPGANDPRYAINFESIGIARMGQQRWQEAEESLQKAVSLFDQQIRLTPSSDAQFVRGEHVDYLRQTEDVAFNFLGVVYFREHRSDDALALLEKAYDQATTSHAPETVVKQIAENGKAISTDVGNDAAITAWSHRLETPVPPEVKQDQPSRQPRDDDPFELGNDQLDENLAAFVSNHPKAQCTDSTKTRINCYQWTEISIFGMSAHPDPGCSVKNYSSVGCVEGLSAQFVNQHLVLLSYAVEGKDKREATAALKKTFGIPELDGPVGTSWSGDNSSMATVDVGKAAGAKNGQNLI